MPLVRRGQDEISRLLQGTPEEEGFLSEIASWISSPFHGVTSLLSGHPVDALRHLVRFPTEVADIVIPGDVTKALGLEPEEVSGAELLGRWGVGRGAPLRGPGARVASGAVLGGTLAGVGGAGGAAVGALVGAGVSGPLFPVGAVVGAILGLGIGALAPAKNVRELAALPLEVILDPVMWITAGAKGVPLIRTGKFAREFWTKKGAALASQTFRTSKLVQEARLAGQEVEALKQVRFAFPPQVTDDALRGALWPEGFDVSKIRNLNLEMARRRLAPQHPAVGDVASQLDEIEWSAKFAGEEAGRKTAEAIIMAEHGGPEAARKAGLLAAGGVRFAGMTIPKSPQATAWAGRKIGELFKSMPGNVTIRDFFGIVDADMKAIQIDARNLHGEIVGKGAEMSRKAKPLLKQLAPQTLRNFRRIAVESGPVGARNERLRVADALRRYADPKDIAKTETINDLRRLFDDSNQFSRRIGDRWGVHYDVLDDEVQRALIVETEALAKERAESLARFGFDAPPDSPERLKAIGRLRQVVEGRPARVLQQYNLPMRRIMQRIRAGDEKTLKEVMDALGKAEPGDVVKIGADSVSKAELQAAMVESATEFGPGGLGRAVTQSGMAKERKLAATIEGTEVKRSMKPSELDPLLENLTDVVRRIEGRSVAHRIGRIVRGKKWADDRLQSIGVFEDQPLVLIHDHFRKTATDVGEAASIDMVKNKFGKMITKADTKFMVENRVPIGQTPGHAGRVEVKGIKGLEGFTLDPSQLQSLRRVLKSYREPEVLTGILSVFDRMQGWWKAQALISPAYHSRNFQTAVYQAWVATGHDDWRDYVHATRIQAADGRFSKLLQRERLDSLTTYLPFEGRTITGSELLREFRSAGGQRPGFASTEVREVAGRRGITKLDDKLFDWNVRAGQAVEETVRLSLYRNLRRRGWDRLSAGREMGRVHFLYDMLSGPERKIARRLMPFYSWVRFNVPLTLKNAYESPGKYIIAKKVADYIQGRDELPPRSLTPEWVAENLGVRVNVDKQGRHSYVLFGSLWPAADVLELAANPVRKFYEQATPFLRMPAELYSGVHLGTDWPIERFEGERQEFLGFSLRKRDIKLLQSIRLLNEADRLVGPLIEHPGGAARREDLRTFRVRLLNAMMGARAYPINLERVAAGVLWKKRREISALKSGYIRALVNEDADNARQAAEGLLKMGVALPTDEEIQESLKRSKRRRQEMSQEIRGALQKLGLPR